MRDWRRKKCFLADITRSSKKHASLASASENFYIYKQGWKVTIKWGDQTVSYLLIAAKSAAGFVMWYWDRSAIIIILRGFREECIFECGDEENTWNSKMIMNNRWLLNWLHYMRFLLFSTSILVCIVSFQDSVSLVSNRPRWSASEAKSWDGRICSFEDDQKEYRPNQWDHCYLSVVIIHDIPRRILCWIILSTTKKQCDFILLRDFQIRQNEAWPGLSITN